MLSKTRRALLAWWGGGSCAAASAKPARRPRLEVEKLEDRLVPSGTPTLDLATAGARGSINGAIFYQVATQPASAGAADSFVRLQTKNGDGGIAQGYNTDGRPLQFDEKTSANFTRSLPLSSVPEVNVGGTLYREFQLNINQTNSTPLLSLDALRLYTANSPSLLNYNTTTNQLSSINAGFDLGAGNWIQLNNALNPGSGSANMDALIPNSDFSGGTYVYLYSAFGVNEPAHGGYEQWAVGTNGPLTPSGGTISGTLFSTSGGTLAGWTVTITSGVPGAAPVSITTNANGTYAFSNLATGLGAYSTYTITVQPPSGWTSATTSYTVSLQNPNQTASSLNFFETYNPMVAGV